MTIYLVTVGKTDSTPVAELVGLYAKRINRYARFSIKVVPDVRGAAKLSEPQLRKLEGEAILKNITEGDFVALLDENGDEMRSVDFAGWMQKRLNSGVKRLVFVIGGAYGFSDEVYARADGKLALSKMTFSHQIVRAIFAEQLYRAFSIINNEPYHHE